MAKLDRLLSIDRHPDTVNIIMRTLRTLCGEKFVSLEALASFPLLQGKPSYVASGLKHCYVALRATNNPLWTEYKTRYDDAMKTVAAQVNSYEATEQQEANWIRIKDLHTLLDDLEHRIPTMAFKEALGTAILAFFTLLPPRRAGDYWKLWISSSLEDEDKNIYDPQTGVLILREYKTAKVYGTYRITVPPRLANIITAVLEHHPLLGMASYLFVVKEDGTPYTSCNCIQGLLAAVGADTTPTAIRHSVVSETFPTLPEDHAARASLATAMAHSVDTQRTYFRRVA